MPNLPDSDRSEIHTDVMDKWSNVRLPVPISKPELRALINLMDTELDTAEGSILGAIPAGVGKTWLVANQGIARQLLALIEKKRAEVL